MISSFPSELLQLIFELLSGYDIGALWLSGDRILLHKMSETGVLSFSLQISHRRRTNPFWPYLLRHFRSLRTLEIKPGLYDRCAANIPWERLVELPASLTSITILGDENAPNTSVWPMLNQSFPNLRAINIGLIRFADEQQRLEPPAELLTFLTQGTLQSLSVWVLRSYLPTLLRLVPPKLQALHFQGAGPYNVGLGEHVLQIPPNLRSLRITGMRGTSTFADLLPHTLEVLELDSTFDKVLCTLAESALLPQNLKSLRLTSYYHLLTDVSIIRGLPRSLATLAMRSRGCLSEEAMQALPPSLTKLSLLGTLGNAGSDLRCEQPTQWRLPPTLKYLKMNLDAMCLKTRVKSLPSTLLHLQLLNDCSDYLSELPRYLTSLSCDINPKYFVNLPNTLTFLDVRVSNADYYSEQILEYCDKLKITDKTSKDEFNLNAKQIDSSIDLGEEKSCAEKLKQFCMRSFTTTSIHNPSSIAKNDKDSSKLSNGSVAIGAPPSRWPVLPPLPSSISSIRCSLQCYSPVCFLPRNLKELHMEIHAPQNSELDAAEVIEPIDRLWTKNLPSSLVRLRLQLNSMPSSPDVFDVMPCRESLETLEYWVNSSQILKDGENEQDRLDCRVFPKLGRKLVDVFLSMHSLQDPCRNFPLLPPKLEDLSIEGHATVGVLQLENSHFELLPPRIGELRIKTATMCYLKLAGSDSMVIYP